MSDKDYKTLKLCLPTTLLYRLSADALLRLKEKHGQDFQFQVLTEVGKLHPEVEKQICIALLEKLDDLYTAELAADPSNAARLKTLIQTLANTKTEEDDECSK